MSSRTMVSAFDSVMRPGTASPLSVGTRVPGVRRASAAHASATAQPAEFVAVVDAAIDIAVDTCDGSALLPGVAVDAPLAMLKAYLLYLADESPLDAGADGVGRWFDRLDPKTCKLLGFRARPSRLQVELAFALMGKREHQAPELRGLIALVEFLAGAGMLAGAAT